MGMNPEAGEEIERWWDAEAEKESFREDFTWGSKVLGGRQCSLADTQIFT